MSDPQHRSSADVLTEHGELYMKQLCRHFGHKQETGWTNNDGFVAFPFGRCALHADPTSLQLRASAADAESLQRVEHVVASHLERFAHREQLAIAWSTTD